MIPVLFNRFSASPVGPYSRAVECGDLILSQGRLLLMQNRQVSGSTVRSRLHCSEKSQRILGSQGLRTGSLVKTTVFLRDMNFC